MVLYFEYSAHFVLYFHFIVLKIFFIKFPGFDDAMIAPPFNIEVSNGNIEEFEGKI